MSCRFLDEAPSYFPPEMDPGHHPVRVLEITFTNGRIFPVFVTPEESFTVTLEGHVLNVWHYGMSLDGKRITLLAKPSNSVRILEKGVEVAHDLVYGWPLAS
jgi:hypothetical protein